MSSQNKSLVYELPGIVDEGRKEVGKISGALGISSSEFLK